MRSHEDGQGASVLMRVLARLLAYLLSGRDKHIAQILGETSAPTPTGRVALPDNGDLGHLQTVDHIVVLMLENRSFDNMLGFLSLAGGRADIDGLTGAERETYGGQTYQVHHLTQTAGHSELEDPCHSGRCVDEQLSDGFVASYAKYIADWEGRNGPPAVPVDPGYVMGYHDGDDLPVYQYLASEFCVCDRWFSSVRGATWPNRLYAVTGGAAGLRDDISPPLYNRASFMRFLDQQDVSWRWYSFDPATLRLIDARYRLDARHHHRFSFLDARKISAVEHDVGELLREEASFLDDAAAGALPSVSWIDPHFKDLRVLGPDSNDDHPPGDVIAGQALVLDVYHALRTSPCWEKSMLIVTYDEHGGFYDHVPPPPAPDDEPAFGQYGVRVPAIVISPFVEKASVAHGALFDHTTIIKTILARFCCKDGTIPDMGKRTSQSNHLGSLLTRSSPRRDIADYQELVQRVQSWRTGLSARRYAASFSPPRGPRPLTDLQRNYAQAVRVLRGAGLPAGHP